MTDDHVYEFPVRVGKHTISILGTQEAAQETINRLRRASALQAPQDPPSETDPEILINLRASQWSHLTQLLGISARTGRQISSGHPGLTPERRGTLKLEADLFMDLRGAILLQVAQGLAPRSEG